MNAQTDTQTDILPDVQNIADELLAEMSPPQQHAIDTAAESQEIESPATETPAPVATGGETDAAGETWNPEIHATGADGRGVKTAKGTWRRRRGAGASRAGSVVGAKRARVPPEAAASDVQARAAGVACAHTLFMVGSALGGPEWQPRDNAEHQETKMMETAFGDYFVATGRTEFPPGLALTLAISAYAMPRFTMPQTRSRLTKFKQWIAAKWIAFKDRKKGKKSDALDRATE